MFETKLNKLMAMALVAAMALSLASLYPAEAVQEKGCMTGPEVVPPGGLEDTALDDPPRTGNFEWGLEYNMWKNKIEDARMSYIASFTRFCWIPPLFWRAKFNAYLMFMHDYVHYMLLRHGFNRIWVTLSGTVYESAGRCGPMGMGPEGKIAIPGARISIYRKVRTMDPDTPMFTKLVALEVSGAPNRRGRNYEIHGLKRGRYIIKVTCPGFDDFIDDHLRLRRRRAKKNVALVRAMLPAELTGTVRHLKDINGYDLVTPLPGIEVLLEVDCGDLGGGDIVSLSALTDVEGNFVFDMIPEGEAVLTVYYPGYSEYEEVLFIQAGKHYERDEIILYPLFQDDPVADLDGDPEQGGVIDPPDDIDDAFDQHPKLSVKVNKRTY